MNWGGAWAGISGQVFEMGFVAPQVFDAGLTERFPGKSEVMPAIDLNLYLFIAAVLFVCGVVCMATKRNAIGVLMGVELVLNGANLNFVAFARYTTLGIDGQVMSLFVIVLAAAEAAIALAIALNFYNNHLTIDVDRGDELQG